MYSDILSCVIVPLSNLSDDGPYHKEGVHLLLELGDSLIRQYAEHEKYDLLQDEPKVLIFKETTDQRLQKARQKLEIFDSSKLVSETVRWIRGFINDVWEKIGFNYVAEVEVNAYRAEVSFAFMPKKDDIEKLRMRGYKMGESGLQNAPENLSLLLSELKEFFPNIRFFSESSYCTETNNEMDRLTAFIPLGDFDGKVDQKNLGEVAKTAPSNPLSDEQRKVLKDNLSSLRSIFEMSKIVGKNHCYLVFTHFDSICKVFGYESTIGKLLEDFHAPERLKNQEIHSIEKELMARRDIKNITPNVEAIFEEISQFFAEKLGLATDVKFLSHGQIEVTATFRGRHYLHDKNKKFAAFEDVFETKSSPRDPSEMFAVSNDKNRKKLLDAIFAQYPGATILELKDAYTEGDITMRSIKLQI